MNEEIPQRIRAALWDLYDELGEAVLDADEAEARAGVLDSLISLATLEAQAEGNLGSSRAAQRLRDLTGEAATDDS